MMSLARILEEHDAEIAARKIERRIATRSSALRPTDETRERAAQRTRRSLRARRIEIRDQGLRLFRVS